VSRPLRVLSITTLFPRPDKPGFGGFVARQFAALVERGDADLTVISPIARPLIASKPSIDTSRGYPVHYLPFATVPKLGARWNPALIARAALPLVCRLHAEQPFDLIDAQFFYPDGPAAARIAKEIGLPLSIKARGSDIHYWGTQDYALRQMLRAAEQASELLAVSEALKADMVGLGMAAERIAVHYTGLDHTKFWPRPSAREVLEPPVPFSAPLLVSIGNLIPLKGHALAIEALSGIPAAHLLIAGDGPEQAALSQLAARLGLADRVHLLGSMSNDMVPLLLAAADAFVLPSEREGLANVWIEALACGTPLVITNVGGAREVVGDPSAGRLVERSPRAIANAVCDLLADPPARADVARHAARFSWEANAAQLAAHYQRIAKA